MKMKHRQVAGPHCAGCGLSSLGLRNPIAKFVQRQTHSRHRSPPRQSACRTRNNHVWPESSLPFGGTTDVNQGLRSARKNDSANFGLLRIPSGASSLTTRGDFLRSFQIPKSSPHSRPGTFLKGDVNLMACRDAHFERINQCLAVSRQTQGSVR